MAPPHKVKLVRVDVKFQSYPGTAGTDADRGIANAQYVLSRGGKVIAAGVTPASGQVSVYVPKGGSATIEIFGTTYGVVALESLENGFTLKGRQRRLQGLGYELGHVDGVVGLKTGTATLQFQADNAPLTLDGKLGFATGNQLKTQFGE